MSSNICYVCDEQTDWRNDFSKIKTQHSKTAIVKLLEKFLGNFETKRDLKNESNRICIECITKIDEYDWTCVLMLNRGKEIRKILLRTEQLYAERKLSSGYGGNEDNHNSNAINSASEWVAADCGDFPEPKVEIEEIETNNGMNSMNDNFTNQPEQVLIKNYDSDEDFDCPNDNEHDNDSENDDNNSADGDYDPSTPLNKTNSSKKGKRRSTRVGEKMINDSDEPSAENEDETTCKRKRGRKKGQKNSVKRFSAKCSEPECGQEFNSANSFMNHKRWHRRQREPKFKCKHCTFILTDQKSLDEHEALHKYAKKLECVICHRLLSQKGNLGLHMKIHQGIRDHICDICGKDFLHVTSFEAHMKYHNNERNIKCPHCTMTFVMSSHLNRHLQTHKKDKPYVCKICNNRFGYITNLRIHEKMHAGKDKNQICSICGANYARKAKLIQHMLRAHGTATPHIVIENGLQSNEMDQPLLIQSE